MSKEITPVLKKIFVKGFYKIHGGMFIFLFASVISSCFFVNTLGELPPGTYFFWHFIITITLVSNPMMMILFFLLSLFYAIKNIQYIQRELQKQENLFLFYSINNLSKTKQFVIWLKIEFYNFLPLVLYTFFCVSIGIFIHNYSIPICILLYVCLLVIACAVYITRLLNNKKNDATYSSRFVFKNIYKPFFVLYTYYIVNNLKLTFLLTKFISAFIVIIIFYNYPDLKSDVRMSCIAILLIIAAHTLLIYRERNFNNRYLVFSYNFPYSFTKLYFCFTMNYLLILLPEFIWLFTYFNIINALQILCLSMSIILLFRSIINLPYLSLYGFIKIIFVLLGVFYLLISYRLIFPTSICCFAISYIIFRKNYYFISTI
ncbi:MAG: hypothetical protein PW786_03405 [Arachidicoccus sp.]|nr:hypothetical protein [Arachidicoccus sp.]